MQIKKKYFLPGLIILSIILIGYSLTGRFISNSTTTLSTSTQDFRPLHCRDNDCVDRRVFQYLPNMPADFLRVKNYLNPNVLENFSGTYTDESYYKQPEFYSDFDSICLSTYLNLKPGAKFDYIGVSGFGIFPTSTDLRAERGKTIKAVSYWHASCGVLNYQGIALKVNVPDEKFQIKTTPNYLLLAPTFPAFANNWTAKVEVEISIPSDVAPGKYILEVSPGQLPTQIENEIRTSHVNYASFANSIISSNQIKWEITLQVE